jgi:hypothetical protein
MRARQSASSWSPGEGAVLQLVVWLVHKSGSECADVMVQRHAGDRMATGIGQGSV